MKKGSILAIFAMMGLQMAAQVETQQPNDDQLQQQAPRATQQSIERANKVEAVKQRSNSEVEAEMNAKQKGQTQRQTKVQPVGINPDEQQTQPQDLSKTPKPLTEDPKRRN